MTGKQIKEELKQVVTNLGNIEFTVEDELKFCKEVLKRKEKECEWLKRELMQFEKDVKDLNHFAMKLKTENDELTKTLTEIKEIAKKSVGKGQMISGGWLYQKISEVVK